MTELDFATWSDRIFSTLLRHDIRQVAYVPDAGHLHLIDRCISSEQIVSVPLTTEEEGVALLAGAWLGGDRGVLLMQSSGVGNCLNMFSLTRVCQLPLLMLVTMRGEQGEFNPWQIPMGQSAGKLLTTAGVQTFPVFDSSQLADTVDEAARQVFENSVAAAVLISQSILGTKTFEN
ncbi:MAG: phosphonopyruvate decarboxylase [Pseudomonadales bacterium]|jgi:sulfopyruvate decarboxylase alpha subunit|nr:phosphonopyruvate decarboxylase [Pseudomonadales bacterium]